MKQRLKLYYSNKLFEKILITNNQLLAQQIGVKLMGYKAIYTGGNVVTDWNNISKVIGYPRHKIYNTNGKLTVEFSNVIKALQSLAVNGFHTHEKYTKYLTHNKSIIGQN